MLIAYLIIFFLIITPLALGLGKYIAYIYSANNKFKVFSRFFQNFPLQTFQGYFLSLISFNIVGLIFTLLIIYFQEYLPFKGNLEKSLDFAASLNAAMSFATGTFWQSHNPENELSMFSHIFALSMQNFLSGGTGLAVFAAFVRGILNNKNPHLGNFYDDFLRSNLFILFPFSFLIALVFLSQSVPHDFTSNLKYFDLSGIEQKLYIGPVAGQMAIKHLAANGGSLFASGAAHPFEAPSRGAIVIALFLLLLLPFALIFAYGYLINEINFSWGLYFIIIIIMSFSLYIIYLGEENYGLNLITKNNDLNNKFNYLGKELIYDKFPSLMWILSVTISSSGSPNACLENYSPLSTLIMFSDLIIGKFIIEGVGSGFFAMLAYLIIAIFLRGITNSNIANFFGKKITINEINYVIIEFLLMPIGVLLFTCITFLLPIGKDLIIFHGPQAITDITYNFASAFMNNGSALTGLNISNEFFNYMTTLAMFIGRYPLIYFSLALSGSFACKQKISKEFVDKNRFNELSFFLVVIVLLVGVITFLPLIILGPLLEFIELNSYNE